MMTVVFFKSVYRRLINLGVRHNDRSFLIQACRNVQSHRLQKKPSIFRRPFFKWSAVFTGGFACCYFIVPPLNKVSYYYGQLTSLQLPIFLRKPLIGTFARLNNCNLDEADPDDILEYHSVNAFFQRRLKSGVRPIDRSADIVVPADSVMINHGEIAADGTLEQIKGHSFKLTEFLGLPSAPSGSPDFANRWRFLKQNPDNKLFYCVFYLSPRDCHRFISPTEWNVECRHHYPGTLLSVRPSVLNVINRVFCRNERAVYVGKWKHGFFSMTPVGATMVGSIQVRFDPDLKTNRKGIMEGAQYYVDFCFPESSNKPSNTTSKITKKFSDRSDSLVPLLRGHEFGSFSMGSTIVLVFEAPEAFTFIAPLNEQLMYGSPLGGIL